MKEQNDKTIEVGGRTDGCVSFLQPPLPALPPGGSDYRKKQDKKVLRSKQTAGQERGSVSASAAVGGDLKFSSDAKHRNSFVVVVAFLFLCFFLPAAAAATAELHICRLIMMQEKNFTLQSEEGRNVRRSRRQQQFKSPAESRRVA